MRPSFAKLTGANVPTDRTIDGKDALDVLLGKPGAKSPHEILYYETEGIRRGAWKLVRTRKPGKPFVSELYNLRSDLGESTNLATEHPEIVNELESLLADHATRVADNTRPAAFVDDARPILTKPGKLPRLRELIGVPSMRVGIPAESTNISNPKGSSKRRANSPFWVDFLPAEYKPAEGDVLIADFEGSDYGDWQTIGEAMGNRPSQSGTHKNRTVGYQGKGFVNTFLGGDRKTGELVSPPLKIERRYINFLIGGGDHLRRLSHGQKW